MRNSPFQSKNTSMTKLNETNQGYKHHRKTLETLVTKNRSPKDHMGIIADKQYQLGRTRKFEQAAKFRNEELANLRLLNQFIDIQKGNQLSVGRANYRLNMV